MILLNIKNISKQDPDPDPVRSSLFGVTRIRTLKTGSADPDLKKMDRICNTAMYHVGLPGGAGDEDIVQMHKTVGQGTEDLVLHPLERAAGVPEPEGHPQPLEPLN